MAPKKADAKGKAAKGKDAKGKEAPSEPITLKDILRNPATKMAVLVFTLLLVLVALVAVALFFVEEALQADDVKGLALLRDFIIGNNESLKTLSDETVIKSAYDYMKKLTVVRDKNKELRNIIEFISKDPEWVAAGDSRFYFGKIKLPYFQAKRFCEDMNSEIAEIIGDDVQIILEKITHENKRSYWIGLRTNESEIWYWNTKGPLTTGYWQPDRPTNISLGDTCVVLGSICPPIQCWTNVHCRYRFGPICMKKRDPQWMY